MSSRKEYKWTSGASRNGFDKCDPNKAAAFFDKLAKEGRLNKETVRKEAENPRNPLHGASGWLWGDDSAAAERWRNQVASNSMSGLRVEVAVVIDKKPRKELVPAFVQVGKTSHRGLGEEYKSFDEVMQDPIDRADYLKRLIKETDHLDLHYAVIIALYPKVGRLWSQFRKALAAELPN